MLCRLVGGREGGRKWKVGVEERKRRSGRSPYILPAKTCESNEAASEEKKVNVHGF